MASQEWGFVALESGVIQAGIISEAFLSGERVLKVELINPEVASDYEYYSYKEVKGIKICSQEEINALYPQVSETNLKLTSVV